MRLMSSTPEFTVSRCLHEGAETSIFQAARVTDGKNVVLKLLHPAGATVEALGRFRLEYEMARSLTDVPGVIRASALVPYQNSLFMVLEDIGGESLDRLGDSRRPAPHDAVELCIRVAGILAALHARHVTHLAITPENILWNPATGELRLIDFGSATELPSEKPSLHSYARSDSPLAFVSPEQTGRMNRVVDFRSDFYSLGATLYWLLTGRAPFAATDPMALIYSHLATPPRPPRELEPTVSPSLSAITLKLLEKTAEARYQSAEGLVADLRRCADGEEHEFPLGQSDLSERLRLPQKLYGREHEVALLLEAFAAASSGPQRCLMIGGYSGVGKTALVHEIHRPITRMSGFFVEGKFDQIRRNIPYSAWVQALEELVSQLLIAPPDQLASWRAALLETIGPNGKVLLDVIPNLALVTGDLPEVPELGPVEAENRFIHVFKALIRGVAQASHPLVIFLDDLQWIDAASLKLLKVLLEDRGLGHFFLIGAYRDNEVDASHPLMTTLEQLRQAKVEPQMLRLENLSETDVVALLSDALLQSPDRCLPLARLLRAKTSGNAFFTHQMLHSLVDQRLLRFDAAERRWSWNLSELSATAITDNVVELMTSKLRQFSAPTQEVLQLAACSGNVFDLQTLAVISQREPRLAMSLLKPAITEGLVVPRDEEYKLLALPEESSREPNPYFHFLHDRVQQAAYSLLPEARRMPTHLTIGYRLLSHAKAALGFAPGSQLVPAGLENEVFDIVHHLDQGIPLIEESEKRLELVQLNLLAGKRARGAAAYASSFRYFQTALAIPLPGDPWQDRYPLTLELHSRATELASLTGHSQEMEAHFEAVVQNARDVLDRVDAYRSRIQGLVAQGDLQRALDTSLEILRLLGAEFPAHPTPEDIARGLAEVRAAHEGVAIGSLHDLPRMTDSRDLAVMRIVAQSIAAAYIGRPALLPLFTYHTVVLSIRSGNAPESTYAYVVYALLLCGSGDFDLGVEFAELAIRVLEKLDAREYRSKVLEVANGHVWHFKRHLRETIAPLEEGLHSGFDTGDLEYAGYNAFFISCNSYFAGLELQKLERTIATTNARIQGVAETARRWQVSFWQRR